MFQSERLASLGVAARRRPNGLVASILWVAGLIAAQTQAQRARLRLAAAGAAVVSVAAVCLLGLSGWFITGAAFAGLAGAAAAQSFNYMMPSAIIRLLAIVRTVAAGIRPCARRNSSVHSSV